MFGRNRGFVRLVAAAAVLAVSVAPVATGADPPRRVSGETLIPASPSLLAQCKRTARRVGYAVPCPTFVPDGMRATPGAHGCRLSIVGAGGGPHCASSWSGWITGSGQTLRQHLVVVGSPGVILDAAHAIDGPGWSKGMRVQPRGAITLNGWRLRWFYVPPATNDGSAFAGHLALVWTLAGHTYAIGYHVAKSMADTQKLDIALVKSLRMVR